MKTLRGPRFLALAGAILIAILSSACDPDYPACMNDEHCKQKNEFCVNEKCSQCRDDSNCKGDCQECEGYRCTMITGCCSPNVPCPKPQVCRDGVCGCQCLSDAECGTKEECDGCYCQKLPDCTKDEDCPDGYFCNDKLVCELIKVCQLEKIYFDFDQFEIRADQKDKITKNAECFANRGLADVQLVGHCDERGTEDYNIKLGEKRAKQVRDALKKEGIDKDSLEILSRGKYEPAVPNARNETDHQKNRRVEFKIR